LKILWLIFFVYLNVNAQIPPGEWHAALQVNDTLELPFTFTSEKGKITIRNSDESISVDEITFINDSVVIQMPVFDSEFRCKVGERSLKGFFYNHARKNNNVIPFHAVHGQAFRFSDKPEKTVHNISGKYSVFFDKEEEESKKAIGVFNQEGNNLSATFLTTTGDYRYLEGEVSGNRLWLSAFDGFHLFLFTAVIKGDSLLNGEYFSGRHWHDTWSGVKDESAELISAESLTHLNPGYDKFDFSFADENGKMISLSDQAYTNKAVIVQLMGTWCSNCMDETKFLSEWYNQRGHETIEIIALDFERITDTATVFKNIRRLKNKFYINYKILYAGSSDKKEAAKALPMLNRVFAYPTTIFLDKEKRPVKIHTGFNGPATGEKYEEFMRWFDITVEKLEE
jgi:thiol-disulfide isomerase/thioredoxin